LEINKIIKLSQIKGTWEDVLPQLQKLDLPANVLWETGLLELEQINQALQAMDVAPTNYCFDLAIARGLDYYTGTVFETNLDDYPGLGSICSGGRYDNLTASLGKQNMPGVGASIGLTRLFSQLMEIGLVKADNQKTPSDLLIVPVTDNIAPVLGLAARLRAADLKVEIYLGAANLKKKMKYADNIGIKKLLLVGDNELASGRYTLKDMVSGEQQEVNEEELISSYSSHP
jgi:histidyl-tRNA synthetase